MEFICSWILLHMNTRINIALISDFLAKLMKLPLRYFDTKMTGDIMQRIGDHGRIESFLTGNSISTLFSFVNFFVFAFVLAYYNLVVLGIFLVGNALYVVWILSFMKYRRKLNHRHFTQSAREQSNIIQLITDIQKIKLNNLPAFRTDDKNLHNPLYIPVFLLQALKRQNRNRYHRHCTLFPSHYRDEHCAPEP